MSLTSTVSCQNFIGFTKLQVRKSVRDSLPGFYFVKEVTNGDRSFLKYENTLEEQTILFIINRSGVCTAINRMYNFIEREAVEKELSTKYHKSSKNVWRFRQGGRDYVAILKEDEWFLKLIIKSRKTK